VYTEFEDKRPSIHELGSDLLRLSGYKLVITLTLPFLFFIFYFVFAFNSLWIPAVFCTMALSFFSYGSTSHDLVHFNLRIPKFLNESLLTVLELICFRSGHAYRVSHLHHHKRFPHDDDIEGAASRMTLFRTFLEGIIFQAKIFYWSLKLSLKQHEKQLIVSEGILILFFSLGCIITFAYTPVFLVYFCLMVAGSWIIPFVTSYVVHTPGGKDELHQTRLFRGKFYSVIAMEHLYHLEHHLYPMVPHKNWALLAKRLDPFFKANQIKAHNLDKKHD